MNRQFFLPLSAAVGRIRASKVVGVCLGVLLLGLGLYQTADSLLQRYADSLIDSNAPATPDSQANAAAAESLLVDADRWFGDPKALIEAGIIENRFADAFGSGAQRQAEAQQAAAEHLVDALARAPADASAWAELARIRLALSELDAAKAAWRMSILIASYEPSLALWRAQIGIALGLALNQSDHTLLSGQLAYAWNLEPGKVAALGKQGKFTADLIRRALANDPKQLAEFNREVRP